MYYYSAWQVPGTSKRWIIVNELQASKRQPGTSGRLHRTVTGEWVWSEEEDEDGLDRLTFEDDTLREEDDRPMNQLQRADSSGSDSEEVSTTHERKKASSINSKFGNEF